MIRSMLFRLSITLIAICCLECESVHAEEGFFSPEYPGLKENGGAIVVANSQVRDSIVAFQKVYGRNPSDWKEVENSGLFDNSLVGFMMEPIDPDDASIDFKGDLYLDPESLSEFGDDILMFTFWQLSNNSIGRQKIEMGDTYTEILAATGDAMNLDSSQMEIIHSWLEDEAQLIQFGHVYQLFNAVQAYREIHGRFPETLNELISSGLGPLQEGAVNPVTGMQYRFDGSKGDLLYSVTTDGRGFSLVHVDLKYEPTFHFPY